METLTYPYGETPESVIRERLAATDVERELAFAEAAVDPKDERTIQWRNVLRLVHAHRDNPDDLLTVLDALVGAAWEADDPDRYSELRISILAALGVTEK